MGIEKLEFRVEVAKGGLRSALSKMNILGKSCV